MKKKSTAYSVRLTVISLVWVCLFSIAPNQQTFAQPATYVHKVVLQGFWWDYWNNNYRYNWANYLTELAPRLKSMGIDAVWLPPFVKNGSGGSVGYSPFDPYDLGDKYQKGGGDGIRDSTRVGTKDDLLRLIAVLHANGIEAICDAVVNHNDGAGSNTNKGGIDSSSSFSLATNNGYKNFRYVSWKTPGIDESYNDYFTRAGRWPKNFQNFHPNPANNCSTGDICAPYFGPDGDFETPGAIGQSGTIPTSGSATIGGITRPYVNPVQPSNYMSNSAADWMKWLKKQTAIDGYRFDAVKHFPIALQRTVVNDAKYNIPAFAAGGQDMFCIGEWVANAGPIDAYVGNVALTGGEEAVGAFDFSLRGYGTNGGIYSMVLSNGFFNMQNLQYDRQAKRWMDYGTKRVYRTSPFVNSHDTYRPRLNPDGTFLKNLGDASGWDTGNELGGNGQHIDPREPRLGAAYAAAMAFDGNPIMFFEDLFNVGTTGKRWTHQPTNGTDLPVRGDLQNILQAHQKLGFKDTYEVLPTNYTGGSGSATQAPAYTVGSSSDHFVIERKGKAIIGITDAFSPASDISQDQQVYISVSETSWIGKALYDYSGAHGLTTSTVFPDGRVLIRTSPNGHNIPGVYGHGYSIWAPAPTGVTFTSVADMYAYLGTYAPPRNPQTTQEWEMADDLGDSHCKSRTQGGALPPNATNERIAGRIFVATGTTVTVKILPETDGRDLTTTLYDGLGNVLATASGISTVASPVTLNYSTAEDGWVVVKVRNTLETNAGQRVWVNVTYTAPMVVNTNGPLNEIPKNVSIWTGNKGTTDVSDCGNWENGFVPGSTSHIIVYGHAKPYPILTSDLTVNKVTLKTGGSFTVNPNVNLTILSQ